MSINKMSYKGQIVIPKQLREKYGLKPECSVRITEIDGHIAIIPLLDDPIKDTRGILKKKYPEKTVTTDEMIKEYRKEEKMLESRREAKS
ncbi:AbrB/MazE/SpoVT family DNA-binding domain-containing protein [Desulfoscipio geothermicus]|uniref:Transcriptional regulator, AbrB family n=1 Tax=Desulfoscipio geothermicus DSM 3669 TaxID=1121426 RepID=A0A1I6EIC1_9FIRM|nr:AbrB/MazE/SpoVT family DNA-binding domain-containing protein [Desulfoscipio geothermicus]SFR17490.1 transcriptional regulator, AbrB family [Desulfoscipio geothermicus DSM 3669]